MLDPTKAMAMMVIDLLADGDAKGKEVLSKSKPDLSKREYISLMDSQIKEEEYEE